MMIFNGIIAMPSHLEPSEQSENALFIIFAAGRKTDPEWKETPGLGTYPNPNKTRPPLITSFCIQTYHNFVSLRTHLTMAKKALAKDQIVKLIVGAGQASPSPPVGPALGSKGVKSMDFCKVRSSHRSFFGFKRIWMERMSLMILPRPYRSSMPEPRTSTPASPFPHESPFVLTDPSPSTFEPQRRHISFCKLRTWSPARTASAEP